jgi:hypothetical protein
VNACGNRECMMSSIDYGQERLFALFLPTLAKSARISALRYYAAISASFLSNLFTIYFGGPSKYYYYRNVSITTWRNRADHYFPQPSGSPTGAMHERRRFRQP